ncbi:MAG: STAS domain-containing protein [Clostridia bacterium]|nr:STAS domain-containing protein [Clostridia bacterium]
MLETTYVKQGNTLTVKPTGRLDTLTSPMLEKEMQQYLDGITNVIMDFENLEYLSSGGLRLLLATEKLMEERGGCLEVIHANEYIIEVFAMVDFMDVIKVEQD